MEPVKSEGRAIPGYSLKQDGTKVSDEQIKERQRMRVVRYNRHYLNGNYLEQIRFPLMARSLRLIILHKHVKRLELFMSVFRHEHRI
ncbi:hypothetical protein ACKE5C_18015 [Aneurinibacillus thermoaerophilus]|uniref:Uncharacterized protein n=1 Tax=Aneurinibacillus thermoaerophilus TaxID=143495 RepID=A0ABX8Y9Y9_ANETH|nr:hypothetical protein [Aneurinibacillus thermoaerophilus]QYY42503.1 hypothetical protein K3F53_16945 [Aneurinibacillus thermoaerophilus]QYY42651.1 hypothetical protein K3F53_17775 [Aneurinibacillus thermoaerophilus]QYY42660.1 hypothetical protein K3F53_17825 [Aneurinibacillus thermoaerophilus]